LSSVVTSFIHLGIHTKVTRGHVHSSQHKVNHCQLW